MTRVLLERKKDGALVSCSARGHAGYASCGSDIVCSALTVLLRTTAQALSESDGVELKTDCAERGFFSFAVRSRGFDTRAEVCLSYAGLFLEKGLDSLQKEFPSYIELEKRTVL
ncbi:MAG: ribosomal-processing cysteine protease Prp [Treponema sp.]